MSSDDPQSAAEDARERELVRAIQAGETSRWMELLAPYQGRLYAVCLRTLGGGAGSARARQEAADLAQDAMVKIIQGLSSFDGSSRLSTWMIRVTMNVCLSHLRAQKHRKHAPLDSGTIESPRPGAEGEPPVGSGVEQKELRRRVESALGRLDLEHRTVLVLRDVRGLDYDQIAQVLGVATGTVKSRLFRARAALRDVLEAEGGSGRGDDER